MYGMSHLGAPLLINAMLLYNVLENGFDIMSVYIGCVFFNQIFLAAFFAQILSQHVRSEDIEVPSDGFILNMVSDFGLFRPSVSY